MKENGLVEGGVITVKLLIDIPVIPEKTIYVVDWENIVEEPEYETLTLSGKVTLTLLSGLGKGLFEIKIILTLLLEVEIVRVGIENTIVFKVLSSVT